MDFIALLLSRTGIPTVPGYDVSGRTCELPDTAALLDVFATDYATEFTRRTESAQR